MPQDRDEVDGPADEVRVLRAEVAALRDEVRTRRVVIVDEHGRPRVTLSVDRGTASVRVDAPGGDPSAELFAVGPVEADGPEAGLALVVHGDVVTVVRAAGDAP
jgi:hypothetical protein